MDNFKRLCEIGTVNIEMVGGAGNKPKKLYAHVRCRAYKKGRFIGTRMIKGEINIDDFSHDIDMLCGNLLEKVKALP